MPLPTNDSSPTKFPDPEVITLDNFRRGVITLVNASRLPKNALAKALNYFLVEDGQPALRPGIGWYGVALPNGAEIDGYDYFDFNGVVHLVAVGGGVVYRSTNDGLTWTQCTGATTTSGVEVNMNQNGSYLYLTTGASADSIILYDGSTTLQTYTALVTPAAATAAKTGLVGTSWTYYFKIAAVNKIGFSAASPNVSITTGSPRENWDATTNYVTLTLPAYQANQTRFDVYISEDNIDYFYLGSATTPTLTWKDDGTSIVVPSTKAPTGNTTQGPKVAELKNVGVRQFGVRDYDNRYRIWFTGAGQYSGAFSGAYDGGYLDWQPGGKLIPMHVEDYRDGKGTPLATIWCNSADGQGGILQMSLDTLTIGEVSITVPSAYLLPGSRGTPAPKSVVNVLNNYLFYNSQAFYNLGSAQYNPILSTDEASANIRPNVQNISSSGESKIASAYFFGKVYYSAPIGSTTNNYTMVYDTELKAWLPEAFDKGFKKFLRYTDTSGGKHLLAVKPGDNCLSEISSSFQGDYGVKFDADLLTGLLPATKNRYEFLFTEENEYEFSNPSGTTYIELLGYDRTNGFGSVRIAKFVANSTVTNTGWDTASWDIKPWDDTSLVPKTFSEVSSKRYTVIQRELNTVQWHVYTRSIDAGGVLRSLQVWGTPTNAGHPTNWRIVGQ